MEQSGQSAVVTPKPLFRANYALSKEFRSFFAESVYGGVSPRGKLRMQFLNETNVLPEYIDFETETVDGKIKPTKEVARKSPKSGILREIGVEVIMNMDDARRFRDWLNKHITTHDEKQSAKSSSTLTSL